MSLLGNLFGSNGESQENASSDDGCCSMEIEEIPEDEAEASGAPPQNGTAPETPASEELASEDDGGCCGNDGAAEAEPARREEAPA